MELIGRRLSPGELRDVLDDPDAVEELLFGDEDDDEMPEPELDLDKSWHVLHYLLTGTAWDVTEGVGEAIRGGDHFGVSGAVGGAGRVEAGSHVRSLRSRDPRRSREAA